MLDFGVSLYSKCICCKTVDKNHISELSIAFDLFAYCYLAILAQNAHLNWANLLELPSKLVQMHHNSSCEIKLPTELPLKCRKCCARGALNLNLNLNSTTFFSCSSLHSLAIPICQMFHTSATTNMNTRPSDNELKPSLRFNTLFRKAIDHHVNFGSIKTFEHRHLTHFNQVIMISNDIHCRLSTANKNCIRLDWSTFTGFQHLWTMFGIKTQLIFDSVDGIMNTECECFALRMKWMATKWLPQDRLISSTIWKKVRFFDCSKMFDAIIYMIVVCCKWPQKHYLLKWSQRSPWWTCSRVCVRCWLKRIFSSINTYEMVQFRPKHV